MASRGVWLFSENVTLACELLAGARSLAEGGRVVAVAIGDRDLASEYVAHGADHVYLFPSDAAVPIESYATQIASLIAAQAERPRLLLVGATNRGKTLAAMLAAALETGCSTEVKDIEIDPDGVPLVSRLVYGGAGVSKETCTASPYVLSVPPRSYAPLPRDEARQGEIVTVETDGGFPLRVVEMQPRVIDAVDVSAANTVVCIGRGLAKAEDLPIMQELADALGGVLGCTRPISEDFHWMPKERYIGLSGKKVSAKLYVVAGSSGQIQHIAGAQDSRVILAINSDKNAPVFRVVDYGIIGDLYAVVPALTTAVRQLKG